MNLRNAPGRRGLSLTDPLVTVVIVVLLALAAMFLLRRMGNRSQLRLIVQRNLAALADSQTTHRNRYRTYASRIGPAWDSITARLVPDSGAIISITHADSTGWAAAGTHPGLGSRDACFIYGGDAAHDPRLTQAKEPRCY
jgi:type II secretory pathway pseudopilin PulG